VGQFEPRFQGEEVVPREYFWFLENDTFCYRKCKLHRATCRRFDTIPACDGRTEDGIAVASTALAMRALRRAAKTRFSVQIKLWFKTLV